MSQESYENKQINQEARFDVYRSARPVILRTIKEFIRLWGINVHIYPTKEHGIGGVNDSSRTEFDYDKPIYVGSAFIPSVIQASMGRSHITNLDIFDKKTDRLFFDKDVELPQGSLVVIKDMKKVKNFVVSTLLDTGSPNSEHVYQVYKLLPYNIIDSKVNAEELRDVKERSEFDLAEFEVGEDKSAVEDVVTESKFVDTPANKFANIRVLRTDEGLSEYD